MSKIYIWLLRNKTMLAMLGSMAYELMLEFFQEEETSQTPLMEKPKSKKKK